MIAVAEVAGRATVQHRPVGLDGAVRFEELVGVVRTGTTAVADKAVLLDTGASADRAELAGSTALTGRVGQAGPADTAAVGKPASDRIGTAGSDRSDEMAEDTRRVLDREAEGAVRADDLQLDKHCTDETRTQRQAVDGLTPETEVSTRRGAAEIW